MQLLFLVPLAVLATARGSSQSLTESGSGSGKELCFSLATEPPSEPEESALATVRCHLACINLPFAQSFREKRGNHSVWPYYVLGHINCPVYQQLEECNRGCLQRSLNDHHTLTTCREQCNTECRETCNGAKSCPDPGDPCYTKCEKMWCKSGCKDAYLSLKTNSNDATPSPPAPISPLTLVATNGSKGQYFVDLTESAPDLESDTGYNIVPTGFIIKIRNTQCDWVTYIGKKSPQVTFSLAEYDRMEVTVSFAAVSIHGISAYSPELEVSIKIDEDSTALPGAVENLKVEAEVDSRPQFFGRAVLKISWDPPQQNEGYLEHYVVEILPDVAGLCGTEEYSSGPLNETTLIVQASNTSEFFPVIKCLYNINVHSKPGNESSSTAIITPEYRFDVNITCNRVSKDWHFAFYMNWTIPEQVAYELAIEEFQIWKDLVDIDRNVLELYSPQTVGAEGNKTAYMFLVNDVDMVPKGNDRSRYRLQMSVKWGETYPFTLPAITGSCPLFDATAPLPMPIQNFTLDSYCTVSDKELQLNFSWIPPMEVFGRLTEYEVSLGPEVLTVREEATANGFFTSKIAVDTTTASWSTQFVFIQSDTLYFQMRAHSNWSVASDWTEPKVITSAQFDRCVDENENPAVPVQNLTLDSYCTLNDKELQLNFSWVPPTEVFGTLTDYEVSLGPQVLTAREEATANGFFKSRIAVDTTTASWTTQFVFIQSDTLYFQMRVHSNWSVASDWTEPKVITRAQFDRCVDENENPAEPLEYIYGIVAGIVVVTIGLLILTVLVYAHYKLRKRKRQLEEIMDGCYSTPESNLDPMFSMGPKKPVVKISDVALLADAWELHPNNVIVEECLGEGAFGEVFKGVIKGAISNPKIRPSLKNAICTTVAVKLLKTTAKGSERRDFLQEIEMMKKVSEGQNAHVVSMVGCITVQEPLCLITEFVKHGDLLTYLRTNRKLHTREIEDDCENPYCDLGSICPLDLISFAYQIASGMEYLSSLGIVHRDLACRNVLVDQGKVLKITDFGMSRETDEIYVQKTQGRVPLKWMAIESIIAREFTTGSDVWSYGVLLWEIGTLGGFPYPSIHNEDLLTLLKSGYRMEKPNNCSPEVYDIMLQCWNEEAKKRPTFTQLRANFDAMLLDGRKDAYIDLQIDVEQPHYQKDHLQVSPALKRKSQLSIADIQAFMHELEKSPSFKSTSSLVQGSPLHPRVSFLGTSPSHERLKSSRPVSMLSPRSPEHTQPMNPYVDDPSNLARALATTTTLAVSSSSQLTSRATSEANLPASTEGGEGPANIHITITSEP